MTFDKPQLFKVLVEEFFTRELLDVILIVSNDNVKAEKIAEEMYLENNIDNQIECSAYLIKQVDGYSINLEKDDTFYFTFGTDKRYPFQGGWVEITAPNKKEAINVFRSIYPNRKGSEYYNAADCYNSETFNKTNMFKSGNLGSFCHAKINSRDYKL